MLVDFDEIVYKLRSMMLARGNIICFGTSNTASLYLYPALILPLKQMFKVVASNEPKEKKLSASPPLLNS